VVVDPSDGPEVYHVEHVEPEPAEVVVPRVDQLAVDAHRDLGGDGAAEQAIGLQGAQRLGEHLLAVIVSPRIRPFPDMISSKSA
jgi:hypothetical protein